MSENPPGSVPPGQQDHISNSAALDPDALTAAHMRLGTRDGLGIGIKAYLAALEARNAD